MIKSYKKQVLELLSSGKPIPCYKLVKITHRFGACIFNLRQEGYEIITRKTYVRGKMYTTYQLVL